MPTSNVIIHSHHVIEQSAFRDHILLKKLVEHKLINQDVSTNRLYLPVEGDLADELAISPHRGRTLSSYTKGVNRSLKEILDSPDGIAAIRNDPAALKRVAAEVRDLQDTLKVALDNGDLYATRPDHLTKKEVKAQNNKVFSEYEQYRTTHAQQLKTLRSMNDVESEWTAIARSEQRIAAVVVAKDRTSANLVAAPGEPAAKEAAGRAEFRMAIAHAEQAGRVRLSEPNAALVSQVIGDELPAIGRAGSALSTYKPLSQRGFTTAEFLAGDHSAGQLLRGAGLLASAADTAITARRAGELYSQDNPLAAQSELTHFAGRNLGGWAGGTTAAYALGSSGAGPMVLIAADAYFMSKAGEKAADLLDNRQIYQQTDRDGTHWSFDGRAWSREGMLDSTNDGANNPVPTPIVASYDKARELNYLATNAAAALALKDAPKPDDPFRLPANASDRPSLSTADWTRDGADGQWHRQVKTGVSGENNRGIYEQETALPPRAAELDAEAAAVVARNIANSPGAIAARYELAHHRSGWVADGLPMSPAVQQALPNPDVLTASDGQQYRRDAEGHWASDGAPAAGNLALELDTTRAMLQPPLAEHAQAISAIPSSPPSSQDLQREHTLYRYRIVGTELRPEWREAIDLASQRTRETQGLSGEGSVQLQRGPGGVYGADSPIAHLQRGADGVDRIAAVTSTEDIQQALQEVQARRQEQAPLPDSPELRIAAQSPQERQAHQQALREANRQGVSTQEAQQAASFAAIAVHASRVDETQAPQAVIDAQREREATLAAEALPSAQQPATPAPAVAIAPVEPTRPERAEQAVNPVEPARERAARQDAQETDARLDPQQTETPMAAAAAPSAATTPQSDAHVGSVAPKTPSEPNAVPASPIPAVRSEDPVKAAAPAPSSPGGTDGLRPGDRGQEVEFLQYRLQQVGARGPDGVPVPQTGHYGPETEHAVRQFQQDHGLPATGVADEGVEAALSQAQHARRASPQPAAPHAAADLPAQQGSERSPHGDRLAQTQSSSDAPSSAALSAEPERTRLAPSFTPAHSPLQGEAPAPIQVAERAHSSGVAAPGFGGSGGRSSAPERDADPLDQARPPQHSAQQAFPADHPDYALFAAIRSQLPKGTSEEKAAEVLYAAKQAGVESVVKFKDVEIERDVAFVYGKTVGFHSEVSLITPSPTLDQTLRQTQALDQQRLQEMVQFQKQQEEINLNPTGPVMALGARTQQPQMAGGPGGDGGGGNGGG